MNYVTVFERPGLDEFLTQVSKFADLVLFTAGLEGLLPTYLFFIMLSAVEFLLILYTCHFTPLQVMLNRLLTE